MDSEALQTPSHESSSPSRLEIEPVTREFESMRSNRLTIESAGSLKPNTCARYLSGFFKYVEYSTYHELEVRKCLWHIYGIFDFEENI